MCLRKTMASLTLAGALAAAPTLALGQAQHLETEAPPGKSGRGGRDGRRGRRGTRRRGGRCGSDRRGARRRQDGNDAFAVISRERRRSGNCRQSTAWTASAPPGPYPFAPPGSGRLDAAAVKREAAPDLVIRHTPAGGTFIATNPTLRHSRPSRAHATAGCRA